MLHATSQKASRNGHRRNTRVRFPGIVADAAALGVRRETLWKALTGRWRLPGLLHRYRNLKTARINLKTVADVSGAKETAKELGNVEQKTKDAAKASPGTRTPHQRSTHRLK